MYAQAAWAACQTVGEGFLIYVRKSAVHLNSDTLSFQLDCGEQLDHACPSMRELVKMSAVLT